MKFAQVSWLTLLFAGLALFAVAQEVDSPEKSEPVQISADRLEVDDVAQRLVFIGHAFAQQGDITLSSEKLLVQYTGDDRQIRQIVAEGNVRITQGERVATGQRAVYDQAEERIVLTGEPVVREGSNSVQGQEIVLFLDGKRSIVKGGRDGRVQAVIVPGSGGNP